jgi:hypothetical protein
LERQGSQQPTSERVSESRDAALNLC